MHKTLLVPKIDVSGLAFLFVCKSRENFFQNCVIAIGERSQFADSPCEAHVSAAAAKLIDSVILADYTVPSFEGYLRFAPVRLLVHKIFIGSQTI